MTWTYAFLGGAVVAFCIGAMREARSAGWMAGGVVLMAAGYWAL